MKLVPIIAVLASCASFEDPAIVLDLRVIAMTATPPEQVLDVDLSSPPQLGDLVARLQPSFVCAIVADPGRSRALRWSMTACVPDNGRCDPDRPRFALANGMLEDPEASLADLCVAVPPEPELVAILVDLYENDVVRGVAGLDYAVELRIGGLDVDRADDQFALKQLRVSARIPTTRTPNRNPFISELRLSRGDAPSTVVVEHCAAPFGSPIEMPPGQRLTLFPAEAEATREDYFVPTIDGSFQTFTETIRYQWLATAGSFSEDFTGGKPDLVGNEGLLGSDWFSPRVSSPLDVQLWVIQRDERFGTTAYPVCIRVVP
jgi:hypothetical protein